MSNENFVESPIFHSMFCADCEKKMQGGFKQEDNSFLCAKCVIRKVENETDIEAINNAIEIINNQLQVGNRPTKKELRTAKSWLKAVAERKASR